MLKFRYISLFEGNLRNYRNLKIFDQIGKIRGKKLN